MTLLFYYLLANILFSTGGLALKMYHDKEELEEEFEEFYESSPMNKTGTTAYMVLCLALFAIPYFIYKLVKGDE